MGKVIIHGDTTRFPITTIGRYSGICYGADTSDIHKNYKRGIENIKSNHGRTLEYVQVYMTLDEYSAKVIREYYTHLAGSPSRLQSSTRYIDYEHGFNYVTPGKIETLPSANQIYNECMNHIKTALAALDEMGIPREDSSMLFYH